MITDVIGSYLDTLEEREFDTPFIALLRGLSFTDIHFLHGSFEFGKDFIAKGNHEGKLCQFAFQTKAGDLNLSDWNACRGQIDLLRTNSLAHPAFDRQLPRKAVFVTTGRLVGGAPLEAQEYSKHLQELGELDFTTWDRETLVDKIANNPEVGLAGVSNGALLSLLGAIDQDRVLESELEVFSRRWCSGIGLPLCKAALEAAVVANRLRRRERLDLACYVALSLIRASWAVNHGSEPPDTIGLLIANTGRALFRRYALDLLTRCGDDALDPLKLIHAHELPTAYVTYPVRCLRLVELLALLALLEREEGGLGPHKARDFLVAFLRTNPGASHPISNRWAVSLIPLLLALDGIGANEDVDALVKSVIRWVSDHYDSNGLGLAGPYSNPDVEVQYLLGSPFEHIALQRRSDSYIATALLDLTAIMRMKDLYELARNDFMAVGATLPVIEVRDTREQYLIGGDDLTFNPNMEYSETWAPQDGWKVAPHHHRAPAAYYLESIGRPWDHMAVSAVLRDRHFLPACLTFAAMKSQAQA
jgi:hypothetical protein